MRRLIGLISAHDWWRKAGQTAVLVLAMSGVSSTAWGVEGLWTQVHWNPASRALQVSASATRMWATDVNDYIYELTGSSWLLKPGRARQVSVSASGDVWALNAAGNIYRWVSNNWQQIDGQAVQISAAPDGALFAVDAGGNPKRWAPANQQWVALPGKLIKIAAAPGGEAWGYNASNLLYRWVNNGWQSVPKPLGVTALSDLSVGSDGTVVLLSSNAGIWNWLDTESSWKSIAGAGTSVSVADINNIVVLNNSNGTLWQLAHRSSIDMLVVHAHPDDEGIFGGGVLPFYTQVQQKRVAELIMVTRGTTGHAPLMAESLNRMQELRNAVDVYAGRANRGLGVYAPSLYRSGNVLLIDGGFVDTGCCSPDPAQSWGKEGRGWGSSNVVTQVTPGFGNTHRIASGREAAAWVVARTIRRYRPLVVVSVHNFTGDYGHSNHTATAIGVVEGERLAADASKNIDGLAPWTVRKLYIRGSPLTNYYVGGNPEWGRITWGDFKPGSAVNGFFHQASEAAQINSQTPRQVANLGLAQHLSQGDVRATTVFVATPFEPNYSEWWTLYRSSVGADALSSFRVPGDRTATHYQGWGRLSFFDNVLVKKHRALKSAEVPDISSQ